MKIQQNGISMLISSGYFCRVDHNLYTACRTCETTCQFKAIQVNEHAIVDHEKCMGCGICVGQCKMIALMLTRDESRPEQLEIQNLILNAK